MKIDKKNHALIGFGSVGPNHVDAFEQDQRSRVSLICDRDESKLLEAKKAYPNVSLTTDIEKVFANPKIESLSILTDHAQHAKIAKMALLAGKHVLVEKPIALKLEDARMLSQLSEEKGLVLDTVSQHRCDPIVLAVKKLISQKELGKITSVHASLQCRKSNDYYTKSYWRGTKENEGGSVLINQSYHLLDILLFLVDEPFIPEAVVARLKFEDVIDTEDTLVSNLTFDNGTLGTLNITSTTSIFWNARIELHGTKGSVGFTLNHPAKLFMTELSDKQNTILHNKLELYREELLKPPPGIEYYGISHRAQVRAFINAMEGVGAQVNPPIQAIRTLEMIQALYKSAHRIEAREQTDKEKLCAD